MEYLMDIKKQKYAFFILLSIVLILSLIFSGCSIIPPMPNEAKWTVMVYMAAGNNLETVGIQDINEMELIGSTKDVNIVVQMDRISLSVLDSLGMGNYDDSSNNDWTGTRRYYITQDMNTEIIRSKLVKDLGEKNMGDPETLKDFGQWAIENYPAERYMLVLWNHGGGFRSLEISRDICWDWNFGLNSSITMPELEEALAFIAGQAGQAGGEIDIVGMDACQMAMIEIAYQIKDYGNIMISSEASVPGNGWQYDSVLQTLVTNPNQISSQFASDIVDLYYNQYSGAGGNVTLSAVDLRQIDSLANQLSGLSQSIMNDSSVPKNNYRDARNASQYYTGVAFEYIDLKDFVNKLPSYTSNSSVLYYASQIDQSMEKGNIIINNTSIGSSVINSHGLSIYIPYYSYDDYYDNTNFAQELLWDEMLHYLGY
jgi:hypothetical protein